MGGCGFKMVATNTAIRQKKAWKSIFLSLSLSIYLLKLNESRIWKQSKTLCPQSDNEWRGRTTAANADAAGCRLYQAKKAE